MLALLWNVFLRITTLFTNRYSLPPNGASLLPMLFDVVSDVPKGVLALNENYAINSLIAPKSNPP